MADAVSRRQRHDNSIARRSRARACRGPRDRGRARRCRLDALPDTPSCGNSSRNRDAGLYDGEPQALRITARETYSRSCARVIPTYASRRSSSSSVGSPSDRRCGKTPSSRPVRNTTGNSRPLAVCNVIKVTTPPWSTPSGISSESATSATRSRKSARDPPGRPPRTHRYSYERAPVFHRSVLGSAILQLARDPCGRARSRIGDGRRPLVDEAAGRRSSHETRSVRQRASRDPRRPTLAGLPK